MDSRQTGTLVKMSDTALTIADSDDDVRGRKVLDRDGEEIGKVDDLILDAQENRIRFLQIAHGGFLDIGQDHFLAPVDAVTHVDADQVQIDRARGNMSEVPGYDPELAETSEYYRGIYDWWDYRDYTRPPV